MTHLPVPVSIDLAGFHRRSVASLYSNLVTRPTGRAIRMGVEGQIEEIGAREPVCISILDFTQVRVLDYSCADEAVAKLLVQHRISPPGQGVYFLARGLQPHHEDAIEAALERYDLRLAAEVTPELLCLLGASDPAETACWDALVRHGPATAPALAERLGIAVASATGAVERLIAHRVALPGVLGCCPLPLLARDER
jgi:hypothetical protein